MKSYEVRAVCPGKVHFIGEHSVVKGKPAIIAAIDKYANVYASQSDQIDIDAVNLGLRDSFSVDDVKSFTETATKIWDRCYSLKDFKEMRSFLGKNKLNTLKAMVGKSLEKLDIDSGIDIKIDSEIPISAGLGSSAALSVATSKAISEVYNKQVARDEINQIALEIERLSHGTPSGGDNSTCCFGGLRWFQKPSTNEQIEIPYRLENFMIIQTGGEMERSTQRMIEIVNSLEPSYRDKIMEDLSDATYKMRDALKEKDLRLVTDLMNLAHENLARLKVSTDEMEMTHQKVKEIGGAAKITGAGGYRSCMTCYHPENPRKLNDLLLQIGYHPWKVELGVDGVRAERKS